MFNSIEKQVSSAFRAHIQARYGIDLSVAIEQPRQSDFGEMAVPVAFQLAKQLRQAPKKIATELVEDLGSIEGVAAMEVAGNGYINIRLDRGVYGAALLVGEDTQASGSGEKIIVEHTNINPNKAAHIGHLRNSTLGDTFVRMLRARGENVEVQNYIDNTGVQVADVVEGFRSGGKTLADVRALIADPSVPFDHRCWDLYADISAQYSFSKIILKEDSQILQAIESGEGEPAELAELARMVADSEDRLKNRGATRHAIESGQGEVAELAHLVADAIVKAHLATMLRLDVEYDVLPRESEILHLKFWASAFEQLKDRKAIYFETEGKNSGCWVMPGLSEEGKVIVRSDGTVTYVGKDIAYQLWKFGLLGKDFYYQPFLTYADGRTLYVTTDTPNDSGHKFGHGAQVYNVIDARQSYLQDVVVAGLRGLGYNSQADRSIHFSYEMVALSPRCCADLGISLSEEERKKPYIEVSGRKGLGVKADDLMDSLISKALEEVSSRHAEAPPEEQRMVASQIAIGALRYFLLKFTRNSVIAFDLQEALSFEGETGPYVQYAAVRARNILRKLEERGETVPDFAAELNAAAMARQLGAEDSWQMLLAASKADSALERAVTAGEPAHVAKYAFQLAQAFNNFYHQSPVLQEQDREKKVFLLWMTDFFRKQLEKTAGILGIKIPAYM